MQTTFLFASPSLLSGVARLLDLGARFDSYNGSETSEAADAAALYSDFRMVGQDLQEVMESFVMDTDPSANPKQFELAFVEPVASLADHEAR